MLLPKTVCEGGDPELQGWLMISHSGNKGMLSGGRALALQCLAFAVQCSQLIL